MTGGDSRWSELEIVGVDDAGDLIGIINEQIEASVAGSTRPEVFPVAVAQREREVGSQQGREDDRRPEVERQPATRGAVDRVEHHARLAVGARDALHPRRGLEDSRERFDQ